MRPTPDGPVFTRLEALAAGWTDPALHRAVNAGRIYRVRAGLFSTRDPRHDPVMAAIAAARTCRGAVISHRSAAAIHGLPVLARSRRPEVTVPPNGTGDLAHAALHRARLWPADVTTVDGAPVTSVARTVVDVGRSQPITGAVVTTDAALHTGATTAGDIESVLLRCWNWPGIRRANRAMAAADARSESPLESVSRVFLHALPLPAPQVQVTILDDHGRFIARTDFYWPQFGVVGEADGLSKYETRDVLTAEKYRQERLEELGLVVVRWGWADLNRHPRLLHDRISRAFIRGAARDRSGLPRTWSVCVS